ncbi:PIG-L family deacetylase [Gammaproteobacteria bacterium]|nr:PIG-L family deacetylase [Gammaproteobacteria bacterium]
MKVLFIGAHFDDIEIGCGGTAARLVREGHDVESIVMTHSGYSDEEGNLVRDAEVARREGLEGLQTLGISHIHELNLKTGRVEYTLDLIHELERTIKSISPDLVFTHWIADVHQDHSAIGRATLNVCRKTASILMYRSNWYRSSMNFSPRIFVDTSDYFQIKKKAINCHVSEVTKFGMNWLRFIEAQDVSVGIEFGYDFGEAFEPVKLDLFCSVYI